MATKYGQLWKERPQSIDELKQTILNVRENVSYNTINALVAEMPRRLIQVIAMNGMTIQHLWNNKGKERKLRECKNIDFLIIKIQSVFCIVFFKKWKDIEKIPLLNLSCSIFLHSTIFFKAILSSFVFDSIKYLVHKHWESLFVFVKLTASANSFWFAFWYIRKTLQTEANTSQILYKMQKNVTCKLAIILILKSWGIIIFHQKWGRRNDSNIA